MEGKKQQSVPWRPVRWSQPGKQARQHLHLHGRHKSQRCDSPWLVMFAVSLLIFLFSELGGPPGPGPSEHLEGAVYENGEGEPQQPGLSYLDTNT